MRYVSSSQKETEKIAALAAEKLLKKIKRGVVIGLSGDLGSGKTAFVKGVARALKIKETIISPTFILMRRYSIPKTDGALLHIDAYRLNTYKELKLFLPKNLSNTIVFLEWPEQIPALFKKIDKRIRFAYGKKKNERIITF